MKQLFCLVIILLFLTSCNYSYVLKECNRPNGTLVLKELQVNEIDTTIICAINPRNHTGILLKKEGVYSLEVIPDTQRWKDGWLKPFTANGRISPHFTVVHLFKRKICANWFSLIGSIDNKRSTYFKIGIKRYPFTPKKNGELVCFANDVWGDYWYTHNNKGALTLIVKRIK